jgi:hypothetical protein
MSTRPSPAVRTRQTSSSGRERLICTYLTTGYLLLTRFASGWCSAFCLSAWTTDNENSVCTSFVSTHNNILIGPAIGVGRTTYNLIFSRGRLRTVSERRPRSGHIWS